MDPASVDTLTLDLTAQAGSVSILIFKWLFQLLALYCTTGLIQSFQGYSPDCHLCSALNHVKNVLKQVDLHVLQLSVDTTMHMRI